MLLTISVIESLNASFFDRRWLSLSILIVMSWQLRMVKDLKAEEMLEKERRSNVLKVQKIPNVANVRRGEYERQRAKEIER